MAAAFVRLQDSTYPVRASNRTVPFWELRATDAGSYNDSIEMRKDLNVLSELAIFFAGALAVGLLSGRRKERAAAPSTGPQSESASVAELRKALNDLEARVAGQEAASEQRFGHLEAKLSEVPSTAQIVGAMEQLLAKTMASLDDRLTTQAQSIEVLKTTVSQTDSLLERVLESLDSLQSYTEPLELTEDTLLRRPAV